MRKNAPFAKNLAPRSTIPALNASSQIRAMIAVPSAGKSTRNAIPAPCLKNLTLLFKKTVLAVNMVASQQLIILLFYKIKTESNANQNRAYRL